MGASCQSNLVCSPLCILRLYNAFAKAQLVRQDTTTTTTTTAAATATEPAGDILGSNSNPWGIAGVRSPAIY